MAEQDKKPTGRNLQVQTMDEQEIRYCPNSYEIPNEAESNVEATSFPPKFFAMCHILIKPHVRQYCKNFHSFRSHFEPLQISVRSIRKAIATIPGIIISIIHII